MQLSPYPRTPPYHNEHTYFVLPTYACNLRCPHCCTTPHPDSLALGAMTLQEYEVLLEVLLRQIASPIDLRFIGGEPTVWRDLDEALARTQEHPQVSTSLFSNLTKLPLCRPTTLFFAINSWFASGDSVVRSQVASNFEQYYRSIRDGSQLVVRYVITERTSDTEVEELVRFVRHYPKAGIGIGFDVDFFARASIPDNARRRALGAQVIRTLRRLRHVSAPGRLHVHDIMPLCLFSKDELTALRKSFLIRGVCTSPEASLTFLPGARVQLCPNTPHRATWDPSQNLAELVKGFCGLCETARWAPRERCSGCQHFFARECQGGCLGASWRAVQGVSTLARAQERACW